MSGTTEPGSMREWLSTPPYGPPLPAADERPADPVTRIMPSLVDVWIVAVWFLVVGVIGALVWWQVTPLAAYTRTADNGTMDEQQLALQIATDGWFVVVAVVGGLVSGIALVSWRRRAPLLMVLLVGAAGFLATVVMLRVGLWLGPSDPQDVLPTLSPGQKAHLQLKPLADSVWYIWSVAGLAGAALAFLGGEFLASRKRHRSAMEQYLQASANPGVEPRPEAWNG